MPRVLIAGGGSGGHVAPAIAIAEALSTLDCTCILAHSNRAIDTVMVQHTAFDSVVLPAKPLSFRPTSFLHFARGFIQTEKKVREFIKKERIDCVISTGGFVAAPALRAARKESCPTLMLNLDDPPGKANNLAKRWADEIVSTVRCTLPRATKIPPPLRSSVLATTYSECSYERYGLNNNKLTLLITGASQGATSINEFLPAFAAQYPTLFHGWQVLHLAGSGNVEQVAQRWNETTVEHTVLAFEQEMGHAWGIADFAVTRGGANTIAEIAINAVPSCILPYPYHKDEHQKTNALPLQTIGGVTIERDYIDPAKNIAHVGHTIGLFLKDHQMRFTMYQSLVTHAPKNGAVDVATACLKIMAQ